MRPVPDSVLLRRSERRLLALQERMDAACNRIRRLAEANVRLRETTEGLIRLLARTGTDPAHSERTAELAVRLARKLEMPAGAIEDVRVAALVHDCARRSEDGADDATGHADRAAVLLESVPVTPAILEAVRCHHDRWDGTGNRSNLRGVEIPRLARVLAVADAFDELTSASGTDALSPEEAASALLSTAGRVHDAVVVEALVDLVAESAIVTIDENVLEGAAP